MAKLHWDVKTLSNFQQLPQKNLSYYYHLQNCDRRNENTKEQSLKNRLSNIGPDNDPCGTPVTKYI